MVAIEVQGAVALLGIVVGTAGAFLGVMAKINYNKLNAAVRLIEDAISPDSVGGEEITPAEAIRIFGTIAEVLKDVRKY